MRRLLIAAACLVAVAAVGESYRIGKTKTVITDGSATGHRVDVRGAYTSKQPDTLYTDSVLWLSFLRVDNGGTNYYEIGPTENNAQQTTASLQPTHVTTNGVPYLLFDGIDDILPIANSASLSGLGASSGMVWMRSTATSGGWTALQSRYKDGSTREWYLSFKADPGGGRLDFYAYDQSANAYIARQWTTGGGGPDTLVDGNWHHVAWTRSTGTAPGAIRLYVDGVQRDDTSDSSGTFVAVEALNQPTELGNSVGLSWEFDGDMSDSRVYNKELTSNEVFTAHSDTVGDHP